MQVKPVRLQRKRTKGYKLNESPNGLSNYYVGRPTVYGNTFYINESQSREIAVKKYEEKLRGDYQELRRVQVRLKGKNLVCWCPLDVPCHADILLKIANEE
jgi:hypothetical protein